MSNVISMARVTAGRPITGLRLAELDRLRAHRFGHGFVPVDREDGFALMVAVLDHLQHSADAHRASFAWLTFQVAGLDYWQIKSEINDAMNRAPVFWRAQALGNFLCLTARERFELDIQTIRSAGGRLASSQRLSRRRAELDPPPEAA